MTPGVSTAAGSSPAPSTALPDPGYYSPSGGGFDPYGSGDGAYLQAGNALAATHAPASPSSPSLGTLALYGGAALGGLFLLSKMFKGGGASA